MPEFISFDFNVSTLIAGAVKVLFILVVTLVLLAVLGRVIPRAIKARIPRVREESDQQLSQRSDTLSKVVVTTVSFIVWIVSIITMLSAVGINVTPIIAAVGVAGLAVGFAAQNIIRDYLNGFFIVIEDWYRVGEVASVAGIGGLVEDINLRRTVLRDANGSMHVIPNSNINMSSNLTRDWARINLNISVGYGENLDNVIHVLDDICKQFKEDPQWSEDMLTVPAVARVDNLGDHGIEIKIMGDTKPIRQWALMGELRKRIKDRFDQEGIEIPWPHTKVYFGNSLESVSNGSRKT